MVTSIFIAGVLLIMFSGFLGLVLARPLEEQTCDESARSEESVRKIVLQNLSDL